MTPGIAGLCQTVAEQVRGRTGFDDKSTLLTAEEIRANLEIQRFLRDHKRESDREALSASEASAAGRLATQMGASLLDQFAEFVDVGTGYLRHVTRSSNAPSPPPSPHMRGQGVPGMGPLPGARGRG